jgi:hypothetical protein
VLVHRHLPLGVPLDAGDVSDAELIGQVLDDRPRNGQGIFQKQPDVADSAHLEGEAEAAVVTAPLRDQLPVLVIEEEESFQFGSRGLLGERPVRLGLLVS